MMARFSGVIVAGSVLALSVATLGEATTYGPDYQVPLHQPTPITAAGFGSQAEQCGSIPATEDGWHFVLPGDFTVFVSLTVTFSPGGTQTITSFGPPTGKHAFAGSAPGAVLESASAIVKTQTGKTQVLWFNLSHTCPASASPSPSPSPSGTSTVTPSPSGTPTPSGTATTTPTPTLTPTTSPSPGPSTPAAPAPTPVPTTLPVTG
jgi:hypothetical protein